MEKAQQGILVLDGLQRVAQKEPSSIARDVVAGGVQRAMIRVMEGQEVSLSHYKTRHPNMEYLPFSCQQLLFLTACQLPNPSHDIAKLKQQLLGSGIMEEVLDRIDLYIPMDALSVDDLVAMQEREDTGLMALLQQEAEALEIELSWDSNAIKQWANEAHQNARGAWLLKQKYASLENDLFTLSTGQRLDIS